MELNFRGFKCLLMLTSTGVLETEPPRIIRACHTWIFCGLSIQKCPTDKETHVGFAAKGAVILL